MIETISWTGRTLVLDNFDSFTWNLVHLLEDLGAEPVVVRPDGLDPSHLEESLPARLLVSPGPGRPGTSATALDAVIRLSGHVPILGVCLGAQCIGEAFGGVTTSAPSPVHGKTSTIRHDGRGCFDGVPDRISVMRYHSLMTRRADLPRVLTITAESDDGVPMGLRHRSHPTEGVQFHPESFLTQHGRRMLENFLSW